MLAVAVGHYVVVIDPVGQRLVDNFVTVLDMYGIRIVDKFQPVLAHELLQAFPVERFRDSTVRQPAFAGRLPVSQDILHIHGSTAYRLYRCTRCGFPRILPQSPAYVPVRTSRPRRHSLYVLPWPAPGYSLRLLRSMAASSVWPAFSSCSTCRCIRCFLALAS